jgi:hypothetical protein
MEKKEIEISIAGRKFKAEKKKFKSGKIGYGLYGKLEIDNAKYQIVCNIVKIAKKSKD